LGLSVAPFIKNIHNNTNPIPNTMKDLHGIVIGNYTTKKLSTKKGKTPQQVIQERINATRGVTTK